MRSIRKQISDSQPGNDIYGMREKIAYYHHLRNPSQSADSNWFKAERDLEGWCFYRRGEGDRKPIECLFHKLLEKYAHGEFLPRVFSMCEGSSFDDWMYAQNKLAEQIMHQVN